MIRNVSERVASNSTIQTIKYVVITISLGRYKYIFHRVIKEIVRVIRNIIFVFILPVRELKSPDNKTVPLDLNSAISFSSSSNISGEKYFELIGGIYTPHKNILFSVPVNFLSI